MYLNLEVYALRKPTKRMAIAVFLLRCGGCSGFIISSHNELLGCFFWK
jgi:hypothetical protein